MSDAGQIAHGRAAWEAEPSVLLSSQPPTPAQYRFALLVSSMMLAAFVATLPFATIALTPFPGVILVQNSLLLTNDLITASLLFSQYRFGRSRTLLILAAAYLFTGMMAASHAITFPGLVPEPVLLHGGPQSTPWIYVTWHGVLPLAVILHALRRSEATLGGRVAAARTPILIAIIAAVGGAAAITWLLTTEHIQLPVLVDQGRLTEAEVRLAPAQRTFEQLGADGWLREYDLLSARIGG